MGHFVFWILHLICIFITFGIGLFVTIPLHLLYASSKRKEAIILKTAESQGIIEKKPEVRRGPSKNDFKVIGAVVLSGIILAFGSSIFIKDNPDIRVADGSSDTSKNPIDVKKQKVEKDSKTTVFTFNKTVCKEPWCDNLKNAYKQSIDEIYLNDSLVIVDVGSWMTTYSKEREASLRLFDYCVFPVEYSDLDDITVAIVDYDTKYAMKNCSNVLCDHKEYKKFKVCGGKTVGSEKNIDLLESTKWRAFEEKSKMTDFKNLYYRVDANNMIIGNLNINRVKPTITVRCQDNKTEVYINWGRFITTGDLYDKTSITYRIDARKAKTRKWEMSTDFTATGLWAGSSIPFLRSLKGSDKILFETTPYGENRVQAVFDITGIDVVLQKISKRCGWKF